MWKPHSLTAVTPASFAYDPQPSARRRRAPFVGHRTDTDPIEEPAKLSSPLNANDMPRGFSPHGVTPEAGRSPTEVAVPVTRRGNSLAAGMEGGPPALGRPVSDLVTDQLRSPDEFRLPAAMSPSNSPQLALRPGPIAAGKGQDMKAAVDNSSERYMLLLSLLWEVAADQKLQPMSVMFAHFPSLPIREVYITRLLINLFFFSRNYVNFVLCVALVFSLCYPVYLGIICLAVVRHVSCRRGPKAAEVCDAGRLRQASRRPDAILSPQRLDLARQPVGSPARARRGEPQRLAAATTTTSTTALLAAQALCCAYAIYYGGIFAVLVTVAVAFIPVIVHATLTPYTDEGFEAYAELLRANGIAVPAPRSPTSGFRGIDPMFMSALSNSNHNTPRAPLLSGGLASPSPQTPRLLGKATKPAALATRRGLAAPSSGRLPCLPAASSLVACDAGGAPEVDSAVPLTPVHDPAALPPTSLPAQRPEVRQSQLQLVDPACAVQAHRPVPDVAHSSASLVAVEALNSPHADSMEGALQSPDASTFFDTNDESSLRSIDKWGARRPRGPEGARCSHASPSESGADYLALDRGPGHLLLVDNEEGVTIISSRRLNPSGTTAAGSDGGHVSSRTTSSSSDSSSECGALDEMQRAQFSKRKAEQRLLEIAEGERRLSARAATVEDFSHKLHGTT